MKKINRDRRSAGVSRINSSIHCLKIGMGTSRRSSTGGLPYKNKYLVRLL